jgi:DNA polymerase-1
VFLGALFMKKILIKDNNISLVIDHLMSAKYIGFDTETTGTEWHDRTFSYQFYTDGIAYYANLDSNSTIHIIDKHYFFGMIRAVFLKPDITWFIHNALFDMNMIKKDGLEIHGFIHDTQTLDKILYNQHLRYGLDAVAKRRGLGEKVDEVKQYIKDNKCYTMKEVFGKKTKQKFMHFDQVPTWLMIKYGLQDAKLVYDVGMSQIQDIKRQGIEHIYKRESELNKACLAMIERGMEIRQDYVRDAYDYELKQAHECKRMIEQIVGKPYVSGPKYLKEYFDSQGIEYPINKKTKNPIFDKKHLPLIKSKVVDYILKYRTHEKYAGTYYARYIKDEKSTHAFIRTDGTVTGRFSYADPNLQNVPKQDNLESEVPYMVRGSFKPRDGFCFVMIDFDQQEFRLMLDYANEQKVIKEIVDDGKDVHQATADMVGIERKPAKSLNFGLLYGMGIKTLAEMLKVDVLKATYYRDKYFSKLPRVERLIQGVMDTVSTRGYIKTWAGRRLYLPFRDRKNAYQLPNHLIQGGCGDIARFAMVELHKFLLHKKSAMLVQVHDEILFEVHESELHIVPELRKIMENIYTPKNGLPLTCGVEHSWVSWGKSDVVKGYPTRENRTKETVKETKRATTNVCIY